MIRPFCLLLFVAYMPAPFAGEINQQLSAYGLTLKNETQWTMKKNSTVQSGDRKIQTMELTAGDVSVEMTFLNSVPKAKAVQDADLEYSSILSAYKAAVTPYAGSVSKKLSCGPRFYPKNVPAKFAGLKVRALVGFASDRKAFGACTESEASLEFAFAAMGLPNNAMLKITGFRQRPATLNPRFWTDLLAGFSMEKLK